MDIHEAWNKALNNTEIIRPRVKALGAHADTQVPYILLSESSVNAGDTAVRSGEVLVQKPSLVLPPNIPQFEGFDLDRPETIGENSLVNFLLVRGVHLPSMHYNNRTHSLDVFEGNIDRAAAHYLKQMEEKENVQTGILIGPEDCWQLSILIYISSQVVRNADQDIRQLLKAFKKR